jgi:hypothetical protein
MPKVSLVLQKGTEKRLGISWEQLWKDVIVSVNGKALGVIPDEKALTTGQEFTLADGSVIKVQLVKTWTSSELQVFHDRQPLPGFNFDPQKKLKSAYTSIYFLAGIHLMVGILSLIFFKFEFLQQASMNGFGSIIFGLAFLVLGFFVQRRSTRALYLTVAAFVMNILVGIFLAIQQEISLDNSSMDTGELIARIYLFVPLYLFVFINYGQDAVQVLKAKNK